jgi:type IV pilus assembly protein PilW
MRKHQPLRSGLNNRGFTLAELLVGLFVSGIVMTTILSAYYTQNKSYAVQDQLAAMVQNLRAAMDIMIRDGSISSDESITYSLADSDGDGDNDLERNSNLIAENIDALDFVYLDENDASTTDPSEIRSIQITMVAKTQRIDHGYHDTEQYTNQGGDPIFGPANDSFRRRRLTAEVKCRNLGL